MGFLGAGFPTLKPIIDKELLHYVKHTIIIELMICACVRHKISIWRDMVSNFCIFVFTIVFNEEMHVPGVLSNQNKVALVFH